MQSTFTRWKGRDALSMTNGVVRAVVLAGGGHLAELRFTGGHGPMRNCLWEAPWTTADPTAENFRELASLYGGSPAGPFLAGFTGHALCLDIFGPPSAEEAARGIPLHGEASVQMWEITPTPEGCTAQVSLPASGLHCVRTITLAGNSSVVLFEERIENRGSEAREIHWVQHVSLGPPLLEPQHSSAHASVDACRTWPLGYEGKELLPNDADGLWPRAPMLAGGMLDLRWPFQHDGKGFLVAARVSPAAPIAHIAALNSQLGLALIYCFRREDFPWIAMWEENRARQDAPWNGAAQVRGMEFGTTPMPLGREAMRSMGSLFETPVSRVLPPGGVLSARYLACIRRIPPGWSEITAVEISEKGLSLAGAQQADRIVIPAAGVHEFLLKGCEEA